MLAAGLSGLGARVGLGLATAASIAGLVAVPPGGVRRRALGLLAGFALLWLLVAGLTGMVPAASAEGHWVQFVRLAPLIHAGLLFVALSAGPALRLGLEDVASNQVARGAAAGLLLDRAGASGASRLLVAVEPQLGNTPLLMACAGGHADVVRLLVARGADAAATAPWSAAIAVVFGVGSFAHAGVLHAWIGFCHAQEGAG